MRLVTMSQQPFRVAVLGCFVIALLGLTASTSQAGDLPASELRLLKFRGHNQTSDAAPTVIAETGMFAALVLIDAGQIGAWDITVGGNPPASAGVESGYENTPGVDTFLEYFDDYLGTDVDTLNANYPNGAVYCFNISGGTAGTRQQCETGLGPENYGNIPYLTGTKFTELNTMEVSQDFTVTIPTPSASATAVSVEIVTNAVDDETVFRTVDFGPVFETSILIPGGTLTKGVAYEMTIEFSNAAAMAAGAIAPVGSKGHNSITNILFTPTGPPAQEYRLLKFRDYAQDSDAQPTQPGALGMFIALILSDVNQLADWNATVDGLDPPDGGFDFGYEGVIGEDVFLEYFDDYAGTDQALVDANYPSAGTEFCFNISGGSAGTLQQCETGLGPEIYANIPYLIGSQFSNLSNLDVTQEQIFEINTPTGPVTAVQFEIFVDDEDETIVFQQTQNSGAPYDTTIEVPADTLQESVRYGGFIEFATATAGGTGVISPNNTNSKGHNVATDFRFTVPEPAAVVTQLVALVTVVGIRRRMQGQ